VGWPDLIEIASRRIVTWRCKFRTVGFEERLVAGPILGSPNTQRSFKDRASAERIGNDRRVKLCAPRFGRSDRATGDDPLCRAAVLEVHIVEIGGERVEHQRGIGNVEARLTTVTVDRLVPCGG